MYYLNFLNFPKKLNIDYAMLDKFYNKFISNNDSIENIRYLWLRAICYNYWYFHGFEDNTLKILNNLNFLKRVKFSYVILLDFFLSFVLNWNKKFLYKNLFQKKLMFSLDFFKINFNFKNNIYIIFSVFYKGFKNFFLPLSLTIFILLLLLDFYNINFVRQLSVWFVVGALFFWLMSGFNFFIKRYKYGKFTGAIQRFWKRTNSYFWLIEGFLFSLFFYYYLNSSQDVFYFVDEANLNQNFLTSLNNFFFSSFLLLFIIFYLLYLLLNISNFNFKQEITHLTIITIFFLYGFLIETYQFYYVINGFFELTWDFSEDDNTWVVDVLSPWTRVKNQYLILALIAKYWHYLFIFISWLFMVFKFYENKKISYTLIGVNIQNYMLLFILNLLFNINWLKWLIRRYYDESFYWFFTDFNYWISKITIDELFTFFINIINL